MAAAARLLLEQIIPGLLPFLFTFPAVIGATLVSGALAGWLALAGCQFLTLTFVLPHWIRNGSERPQEAMNLLLATVSLALVVWATAAYRAAERGLRIRCEREVETLSLLINEVDHRTKNNFQIAAALLHAQGISADATVREELNKAARRLVSIAAIYGKLSSRRPEVSAVSLLEHLTEIAEGLRHGLLPAGVILTVEGQSVTVPATLALTIGLVVNEWITNAIKYAFPTNVGAIHVRLESTKELVSIEVHDDGVGLAAGVRAGAGTRLLTSLVDALDGQWHRRTDQGTTCHLIVPYRE